MFYVPAMYNLKSNYGNSILIRTKNDQIPRINLIEIQDLYTENFKVLKVKIWMTDITCHNGKLKF